MEAKELTVRIRGGDFDTETLEKALAAKAKVDILVSSAAAPSPPVLSVLSAAPSPPVLSVLSAAPRSAARRAGELPAAEDEDDDDESDEDYEQDDSEDDGYGEYGLCSKWASRHKASSIEAGHARRSTLSPGGRHRVRSLDIERRSLLRGAARLPQRVPNAASALASGSADAPSGSTDAADAQADAPDCCESYKPIMYKMIGACICALRDGVELQRAKGGGPYNLARLKNALNINAFDPHGNLLSHRTCLAKSFCVSEEFTSEVHAKAIELRQTPTVRMSKSAFLKQSTAAQEAARERIVVPVVVGSGMTRKAYFDKAWARRNIFHCGSLIITNFLI
mmetsp:Transcript_4390/g.10609  ORF Transcript_4390/g.10609 Transcript_4390/m.10609 type:complete len:337 (-) Transcript_4390:18-1028(-)